MSKDPYKIVNAKPSWASKLASGTVALGSVATAIVITVPGLPGYEVLNLAAGITGQQDQLNTANTPVDAQGNQSSPTNIPASANAGTAIQQSLNGQSFASGVQAGNSSATLSLPGLKAGNTTSPTPYAATSANAGSGNAQSGNVSSPTPHASQGGDEYEDEHEYEDEYESEENEENDD